MSEVKEEKQDLVTIFATERKTISKEIQLGVKLFEDVKNVPAIQVKFLSLRQRIVEDNHTLIEYVNRLKKRYRDIRGQEWVNVSTNGNYRYQPTEKGVVVDSAPELSLLKERLEQVENHIDFYGQSIKTVDNVLFGVRARIDVAKEYDI